MKTIALWLFALVVAMAAPTVRGHAAETLLPEAHKSEDGLHVEPWFKDSWLDLGEDVREAAAHGKRLLVMVELKGCGACNRMHDIVFRDPKVVDFMTRHFEIVQLNLIGAREVTDLNGDKFSEKAYVASIGVKGTPSFAFYQPGATIGDAHGGAAVAYFTQGFKDRAVFYALLEYVRSAAYLREPDFEAWRTSNAAKLNITFD